MADAGDKGGGENRRRIAGAESRHEELTDALLRMPRRGGETASPTRRRRKIGFGKISLEPRLISAKGRAVLAPIEQVIRFRLGSQRASARYEPTAQRVWKSPTTAPNGRMVRST